MPDLTTATTDFSQIPFAVKSFSLDNPSYVDNILLKETQHVRLKFKDIENTTNYYLLNMIWEGTRYEYDMDNNIVDSVKTLGSGASYGLGQGIVVPYTNMLFFSDELLEGDTIAKDIYFAKKIGGSDPEHFDNLKAYFKLSTISEEYYLYGKSYVEQSEAIDFSLFVEPVSVFSNINNGYGIFAGYGQCTDSVFYNK